MRLLITLAALALPLAPLHALSKAEPDLRQRVEAILAQAPAGTRYGLMVTTLEGETVIAIAPDQRFIPASNTKMFTTAAAYARLGEVDVAAKGTGVALTGRKGRPDVLLVGRGDARLSSAADCTENCLATLADAVAAKTHRVNDIVGDDRFYPDERWSPGMSWNNIPTRYGTGISALTLDDNELAMMVAPAAVGEAPKIDGLVYYTLDNRARTVPGSEVKLSHWRDPMSLVVRLTGTIGVDAKPERLRFGIDDPAHYAAWRFGEMLKARGVKVKGAVTVNHRPLLPQDDPKERAGAAPALPAEPAMLAELPALPLAGD
ncbi:MAG: D-alanyl-D-alanine carboxypeptidase, partial [Sphingomonadales bacterium]|nr:D-alanyl-D-alanine carboxypeptidase [Sphingomonadales bacterium]